MSNRSKTILETGVRGSLVAGAVLAGFLALSATLALPIVAPPNPGGSVHAKNAATPDWIVERQTQNAYQSPVVVEADEPSFWI